MARYLIIDTEKEMNSACRYWIARLEQYGAILSEEETLAKFEEIWDAGYERGYGFSSPLGWDEYSKDL